jgi:pimeloyl-ACP methyl ester carboxylesterase
MTAPAREVRAAAGVAGRGLAETAAIVRETHKAVARRIFSITGRGAPRATPTRLLHDGISTGVYAAVGAGLKLGAAAAGQGLAIAGELSATRTGEPATPIADTRRGGLVVGAVNGAWGDWLADSDSPLALSMSLRRSQRDVPLTREALATAYPDATGDLTVWLHGLCETEQQWWLGAEANYGHPASSHGTRLQELTGATPVYLRYNTGRHISDNGEELADLLQALVDRWPVDVTSLTLVGHSMGGLVVRSACCLAQDDDATWVKRVRRIVYLGSPHFGAPLEVGAAAVRRWLRKLPETEPLGRALASRSVGIKDLRHGLIAADEWADVDFDAWLPEPETCAPLLPEAEHYYIGVTLTSSHEHVAAKVFGDALVTWPSASGNNGRRDLALEIDRGRHLGRLHHFDLLNHPRVWAVLRDWLVSDMAPASA